MKKINSFLGTNETSVALTSDKDSLTIRAIWHEWSTPSYFEDSKVVREMAQKMIEWADKKEGIIQ